MSERPVRAKKWILPIAGVVIIAGVGACVAMRPTAPALVATASQQAPAPATPQEHDHGAEAAVPRMTPAELRTAMEKGEVVVVDVRDTAGFAAGHIPGALHIPLNSIQGGVSSLPRDKTLVTYCT